MIQLRSDCLVFEVESGDKIPCSVEKLTIEVLSDSLDKVDPDVIQQAAKAVLHYFRDDLGRDTVTVQEFTSALEEVLKGLGFTVENATHTGPAPSEPGRIVEANLDAMACETGDDLELKFFPRLRSELKLLLEGTPRVVRFHGLRPCAKRLARVQRWCPRSEQVSDEIVAFLRSCWGAEKARRDCALMVN
ncbi:MAG: hypothetical protein IT580_08555 [Verrucomicrobiales bacterium]|nr:hypothetical protein [Verrucomicrobiales bacterium]